MSLIVAIICAAICSGLLISKYLTDAKMAYEALERNALNETAYRLRAEVKYYLRQIELIATGSKLNELLEYKKYGFEDDYQLGLKTLMDQMNEVMVSDKLISKIEISAGVCSAERIIEENIIQLCRNAGADHIVVLTIDTSSLLKEISGESTSRRLELVSTPMPELDDHLPAESKYLESVVWGDVDLQYRRDESQLNKIRSGPLIEFVGIIMLFLIFIVISTVFIWKKYLLSINKIMEAISVGSRGELAAIELNECAELEGVIAKFNEIIQSLRSVQKLQAQAIIGRSAAMIAHDIRKPFANIKALLDILPDHRNDEEFVKSATAQVSDSVRKADAMMTDMLEFSRESIADVCDVGIQSVVSSAVGDVFKSSIDLDIVVNYLFSHNNCLHVCEADIARVLTNIVDNAVGAMKGRGTIWIETRDLDGADGKEVELIIANNGPMIPAEDIDHLFEPFYTRGKKGGTGLGLAICHKIVTANGGRIAVRSSEERTEFILMLPAGNGEEVIDESQLIRHSREIRDIMPVEPENRSLSEDIGVFLDLHKKRGGSSYLLIVDDEPLFRETIRALINRIPEVRENLKVIEADSAEIALKQFEAREFDYVISDIEMGRRNMDGYEFANEILDRYSKSLVMIHSNKRIHGKDENLLGRARFQGFLPKPMDEGELMHFLSGKIFEQPGQRGSAMAAKITDTQVALSDTKKLLVVNDEDFMRTALRFQFKKMGCVQVFEAGRVSDAVKILGEHKIDVVFSDINLGEIDKDGYDVLKHAKGHNAAIKVYMMSGMQKEDEWPKAREHGADGYIQIPYEEEELKKIVMQ